MRGEAKPSHIVLEAPDSKGIFVTGTGTEVGKTIVAAAIARTAAARGDRVRVFKPAVSGLDHSNGAPPDHALLRNAAGSAQSDDEVSPYRYGPAVSPHLAAALDGGPIDPDRVRAAAAAAAAGADLLVVEGVGGFLVPLRADYLIRDFAVDLGLPVVIVAAPGLGTINHTLLTIESVRAAGLDAALVVLNPWPTQPTELERSNRETIAELGSVKLATLPSLDVNEPDTWPALEP